MPGLWSDALDSCLDDHMSAMELAQLNPFPPIGSGRKPRPPLLLIPHFTPPPPTPQSLFSFQLPAIQVPKPAPKPERQTAVKQAPKRQRQPKIWDLQPDLPQSADPVPRLYESSGTLPVQAPYSMYGQQRQKQVCPPVPAPGSGAFGVVRAANQSTALSKCLPRQQALVDLTGTVALQKLAKPSPTSTDFLQQIWGFDPAPQSPARSATETGAPQLHGSAEKHSRQALGCGVDLAALWSAVVEFICSPSPESTKLGYTQEEELPCARCCSTEAIGRREAEGGAPLPEAVCSPRFEALLPPLVQEKVLPPRAPAGVLRAQVLGGKVLFSSPLSVLTPLGSQKSSNGSSPCPQALLAFLELESSPVRS